MKTQHKFTLGQAAKATGKSKSTISKALKSGKISYTEKSSSGYEIEASELFRVFPANTDNQPQNEQIETPDVNGKERLELERLRTENEYLKEERDYLRRSLDDESEERRKLTAMLTDERTQKRRGFWARLLAKQKQ